VGGNLRYFDQRFNIMSMLDYDVQFKALNMFTVQGTLNGGGTGTDYNFLLDRRRSPVLDIRNAVSGTTTSMATLIENGWTTDQLIDLAKQRTATTNMAQAGLSNHLNDKWLIGTDFTVSNTSGLPRTGGTDPTIPCSNTSQSIATEGCLDATPPSGVSWTIAERLTGMGVFQPGDITNFSLSYSKSQQTSSEAFQVSNHSDLKEKWTLDSALRLSHQGSSVGSSFNDLSPSVRASYRMKNNLTVDAQLGLDWSKTSTTINDSSSSSTTLREFVSFGFQLTF
jgi:hypothetical protein